MKRLMLVFPFSNIFGLQISYHKLDDSSFIFLNATSLHVFSLIKTSDCRMLISLVMKFRSQN